MNRLIASFTALVVIAAISLTGCSEPASANKKKDESVDAKQSIDAPVNQADAPVKESEASAKDGGVTASDKQDEPSTGGASPADNTSSDAKASEAAIQPKTIVLGDEELFAGIPGEGELTLEQISAWLDDPINHQPLDYELPLGLSAAAGQEKGIDANPITRAKIELGRQLYFDPRLSSDGTISCASCHAPDQGWTAQTQFGVGARGQTGDRNSPVSFNRILSDLQFWDGRAESLEEQAKGPIANPIEMASTHEACVECVKGIPGYRMQFETIFEEDGKPGEVNIDNVAKAIATFERAVVTGPSPFDYYENLKRFDQFDPEDLEDVPELKAQYEEAKKLAEANPMSESAIRGREIFFSDKGNCSACHVGANLTDEKYHNIGVGMDKEKPDLGRYNVTKDEADWGAFKTPTVRNAALTGPYMHDGSQQTLEEVVEWYDKGGHPNKNLSDKIKKLNLTDQEKKDLVEFLKACTGDIPMIQGDRLPPDA